MAGATPDAPLPFPLRWTALIPLAEALAPAAAQMIAWYADRFPQAPPLTASTTTEKLLTFSCGERTLAVTLVPQPIPWSQLEGPCSAAWYWPDAAESLRDHAAHLIVVLVDEPGRRVDQALALTRMVSATVACSAASAVVWGPGRLVHPVEGFLAQASQQADDDLPLFLWVDFRVETLPDQAPSSTSSEQQGFRLYTTGLEALGATELEVERFSGDPQSLLETVYNIAHYQLQRNSPINEGDTLGVTDEIQVTARRKKSMLGGEMEVIGLDFGA